MKGATPRGPDEAECLCCHRIERATPAGREVVAEGGARRPIGPPERAAWDTIAASLRGIVPPVVAACAACGQPMVGEGAPIGWEIPVPGGAVALRPDGTLVGPQGPISLEAAEKLVAETYVEPPPGLAERATGLFQAGVMALLLVPAAIALFMIVYVFWYLLNLGTGP